jgi:DNA-binding XRE family transcriptional regulator
MIRKRRNRRGRGHKLTDVQDLLGLSDVELAEIELRLCLAEELKKRRRRAKVSQQNFAKRIGTSRARLAKMEAGDSDVSLDLVMRSLLESGSTLAQIGRTIARADSR